MKTIEAEFQARKNLPPRCPSCGAPFAVVRGEDELMAVGEYACGARHMAFRDSSKKACVRRCQWLPVKLTPLEEDSRVNTSTDSEFRIKGAARGAKR